jgi:hypothetical protein
MANDKVIRQARQFADEKRGDGRGGASKEEIESAYNIPPREVDFPWEVLIICVIADIVDVLANFSVLGEVVWFFFVLIILLPFELWYVKQREEKYSDFKPEGEAQIRGLNKIKNLKQKGEQVRRIEGKIAELSKAGKAAEAAKLSGNLKRILPPWLKYLMAFADKIPLIGIIPGNTFLILLSYYDNKATVKAIREGLIALAKSPEVKITRVKGSNK